MSKPLIIVLQLVGLVMIAKGALAQEPDFYLVGFGAFLIVISGAAVRKRLRQG